MRIHLCCVRLSGFSFGTRRNPFHEDLISERQRRGAYKHSENSTGGYTAERAEKDPKVFTAIHMHFVVTGRSLAATAVERAVALSHEKYCSATVMLGKTAEVTTSFDVVEG